ncbi:aldehyde dehydrogenase family protein [Microbacteriaceae bacterium 4G12]
MTDTRPIEDVVTVVGRLRAAHGTGITRPLSWRLAQLEAMGRLLDENGAELEEALRTDMGRPGIESFIAEISFVRTELSHTRRHLARWLRPRRVPVPAVAFPATARTVLEPLGVVLVMAPWNYPLLLCLSPMLGALAAGNCVVLKPSELAPATSAALARLIPRYLDERAVAVVEGGSSVATELLEQRFDSIFYTGSGRVGRLVLEAAARHLTPVTLELGGKSPAYVDDTVDLRAVARRLAWSKYINAGQTCVAPDYVLATPAVADLLVERLAEAVRDLYGPDPATSADYGRIVNDQHFDRLVGMLAEETPAVGGESDRSSRYIAPTVVADAARDSAVMREEIFGPILPVVRVTGLDDAIEFVTARDKPLALYVYTEDRAARRQWLRRTSSGGIVFDASIVHLAVPGLPFGGVGASGTGSYHGERSVTAFSHRKAVLVKPLRPETLTPLMPPFTARRTAVIRRLLRR